MKGDNKTAIIVGVGDSNAPLDIYIRPQGEFFRTANSEADEKESIKNMSRHKPERVVIQAIGRLEVLFANMKQQNLNTLI